MMNSDISNEDTKSYPNLKPVWIDDNDSYSPTIELEKKLESIKKKYNELNYEHLELKNYCESMETELKAMKEEKLKLETLCEKNTAQIPNYRLKIVELNKMNKELKSEKKELEMNIDNYKSKRNGVDQQLKDAIHENFTLRMNNKKLLQEKKACEDGKLKNIKDKDILKSENEKTKAIINDLKEENKKHQKYVAVTNKKYFDTQRKCRKSINEYAGLQKENLRLKGEIVTNTAFIEEIQSLKSRHRNTIRQLRKVESLVRRQELQILSQQNKIAEVERLKVRYIYTGKDITEYKKEIQQWKDKYTDLRLYEQIEALKNKDRLQYQRAMNQCSYDRKKAEATIKELKKVTNPFKIQLANRDATISTLDKQLRIQSHLTDYGKYGTAQRPEGFHLKNNRLMGGVTVLLAGYFRQTLPVVPKGTRTDEIKSCLKRSTLWHQID
ncbi:PREDICTED: cTAGE family member 5-like [Diuraphis noxia]|uniref:cTAGE family member 5-like n=1 Tax=Diuraphis noxia TaxID=143948 RepID=UPI000763B4C1|nr:PREDICTED: cTAGE family member 5-like [Diuraphis noxia]